MTAASKRQRGKGARVLRRREIDRAVAKELAARGVKPAELVGLPGGKGRR